MISCTITFVCINKGKEDYKPSKSLMIEHKEGELIIYHHRHKEDQDSIHRDFYCI